MSAAGRLRRRRPLRTVLALALVAAAAASSAASAAWRANVNGNWQVFRNNGDGADFLQLAQGDAGANGCSAVSGTFYPGAGAPKDVAGSYCSATGRLLLVLGPGVASELWTLQLPSTTSTPPQSAAGTASVLAGGPAALAEVPIVVREMP